MEESKDTVKTEKVMDKLKSILGDLKTLPTKAKKAIEDFNRKYPVVVPTAKAMLFVYTVMQIAKWKFNKHWDDFEKRQNDHIDFYQKRIRKA